jgi:glycerol-1-phosphate dehydrogenase [NAD(P)+]
MLDLTNTNVTSLLTGSSILKNSDLRLGRTVVTTMEIPWSIVEPHFPSPPGKVLMVSSMEESWLEQMLETLPECDSVVGIGGGQAIDAAKYISWKKGIRLVSIPTILSVDAFVTPAAGIRRNNEVFYVGNSTPDPLIIDFEILRKAPKELNIAGVGDLLSIHTASFDWELAQQRGKSEYPFSAEDLKKGKAILKNIEENLEEIKANTDKGLMAIVTGYMTMNRICLPAGHYRIEEGSEHYLFYELEERLKRPFVHGFIIGLGIYLMSRLQQNQFEKIKDFMDRVGLTYHPADLEIEKKDLVAGLLHLKQYVKERPNLWFTIIHEAEMDVQWIEEALADLKF